MFSADQRKRYSSAEFLYIFGLRDDLFMIIFPPPIVLPPFVSFPQFVSILEPPDMKQIEEDELSSIFRVKNN